MKSHPLIFQAWGIRAIRNVVPGSWPAVAIDPSKPIKTMTRRVMKPQPERCGGGFLLPLKIDAPFAVGNQIWTRETWFPAYTATDYDNGCVYKADYGHRIDLNPSIADSYSWKPSIHMPRWASRDDLLIHNIRVERVQDISEADAKAEGISLELFVQWLGSYKRGFRELWNTLHAKPKLYRSDIMQLGVETPYYVSFPWDEFSRDSRIVINDRRHYHFPNPYVWVYEMGRL